MGTPDATQFEQGRAKRGHAVCAQLREKVIVIGGRQRAEEGRAQFSQCGDGARHPRADVTHLMD